jgi:hypothetical protein
MGMAQTLISSTLSGKAVYSDSALFPIVIKDYAHVTPKWIKFYNNPLVNVYDPISSLPKIFLIMMENMYLSDQN